MNGEESTACQGYLQRLEADHARVNIMLRELHELCEAAPQIANAVEPRQEMVAQLTQLRGELAKHFREEEDGGCIEEAVCRCPSLSSEVGQLESQHALLLDGLDQLVNDVRDGKCVISSRKFQQFEQQLREHEEHEERVVRHGFNVA